MAKDDSVFEVDDVYFEEDKPLEATEVKHFRTLVGNEQIGVDLKIRDAEDGWKISLVVNGKESRPGSWRDLVIFEGYGVAGPYWEGMLPVLHPFSITPLSEGEPK